VVVRACELVEADQGVIVMPDRRDPGRLVGVVGHNVPASFLAARFPSGEGVAGHVLQTGESLRLADYAEFSRRIDHETSDGVHAALGAPIGWDGEIKAAIAVARRTPGRSFGPDDVEHLAGLAELAAMTLDNAEMRLRLEEMLAGGIRALTGAVELRDGYTGSHSEEVTQLARQLALRLDLGADETEALR
jgi:GAF domain-containing protein